MVDTTLDSGVKFLNSERTEDCLPVYVHTIVPKSILVVEDDPTVAETLHLLLSIDRHQVETVADGETALARCSKGAYDLVITDFLMPGLDGLDLAQLIKERSPHTPVILATGHSVTLSHNDQPRMRHIDAVLGKPFSLDHLHEVLRAVFPLG